MRNVGNAFFCNDLILSILYFIYNYRSFVEGLTICKHSNQLRVDGQNRTLLEGQVQWVWVAVDGYTWQGQCSPQIVDDSDSFVHGILSFDISTSSRFPITNVHALLMKGELLIGPWDYLEALLLLGNSLCGTPGSMTIIEKGVL